jgi:DNA-binding response OmpR family regulator
LTVVLLLTSTGLPAAQILPALSLLDLTVREAPAAAAYALSARPELIFLDARHDLLRVRPLVGELAEAGVPVIVIVTDGGWAAVSAGWGASDVILNTAGPGEVDARIRLAISRSGAQPQEQAPEQVRSGELVIDEATYSARIRGAALDLTFKEFELLKFLAQHPRRVFTRSQLLQEVWGYDYYGGTRTVDVHVRRLRAKLGAGNEALIGTVRNVGYKFVPARGEPRRPAAAGDSRPAAAGGSRPAAAGGSRPASGESRPAAGDRRPGTGPRPAGARRADGGGVAR